MPLSLILSQRVEQVNPCCCSPDSFAAHDCRSCAETPDDVPPTSLHSSQGASTHRPCSDERREWSLGLGSQAILRSSRHRVSGSSDSGDVFPKSSWLKDGRSSRRTVGSGLVSAVQMACLSQNHWPLHFGKVHSPDIVESLNGGAGQTFGRTYGQRSKETWELALYEILGDALEHNLAIM